jgi:peptidoglycan-associated lipoprotein
MIESTSSRRSSASRFTIALVCAAMLTLTAGCHKKQPLAGSGSGETAPDTSSFPAPTASITADPQAIDLGGSVVLNWRTTNATSVSIDGIGQVALNGTQTVSPANSTNFHLIAKGDGGTTEANVRVTVRVGVAPAPIGDSGTAGQGDAYGTVPEAEFHANVQDVFFDYDSYDVRTDAVSSIASAARYLNAHPGVHVVINGYCDDRGSTEYNLTLGQNRADAARTALINAGVAADRLRSVSYGKERQFCTDETDACWQENRRAQFVIDHR